MSGFKEDIISILKHNDLFHNKSIGIVAGASTPNSRSCELYWELSKTLRVANRVEPLFKPDYVILLSEFISPRTLLTALGSINQGGLIVMEITGKDDKYANRYVNKATSNSINAQKVIYEDRTYLVFLPGADYGN